MFNITVLFRKSASSALRAITKHYGMNAEATAFDICSCPDAYKIMPMTKREQKAGRQQSDEFDGDWLRIGRDAVLTLRKGGHSWDVYYHALAIYLFEQHGVSQEAIVEGGKLLELELGKFSLSSANLPVPNLSHVACVYVVSDGKWLKYICVEDVMEPFSNEFWDNLIESPLLEKRLMHIRAAHGFAFTGRSFPNIEFDDHYTPIAGRLVHDGNQLVFRMEEGFGMYSTQIVLPRIPSAADIEQISHDGFVQFENGSSWSTNSTEGAATCKSFLVLKPELNDLEDLHRKLCSLVREASG